MKPVTLVAGVLQVILILIAFSEGYIKPPICNFNCTNLWFSCISCPTSTGTADGLGIEFSEPQGQYIWKISNPNTWRNSDPALTLNPPVGLYVDGNPNWYVSNQNPLGPGMQACTLTGAFNINSDPFGAPGGATLFGLGGGTTTLPVWSVQRIGVEPIGGTFQDTSLAQQSEVCPGSCTVGCPPLTSSDKQFIGSNNLNNGITVNCYASAYNPCVSCPNNEITINGVCCSGPVNWAVVPPQCCPVNTVPIGSTGVCCPTSNYVVMLNGTCCPSNQYWINSAGTLDSCCASGTVIISSTGQCCPSANVNDQGYCCSGPPPSGQTWKAAGGVATSCCQSSDWVSFSQPCCTSPSLIISGQCCPSANQATIGSTVYCCSFTTSSSTTYLWINGACCASNCANNVGTSCCGTPPSGQTWVYVSNNACCPSNDLNTDGVTGASLSPPQLRCCSASGMKYTSCSESGAPSQYCCPAANVLIQGSTAYCCANAATGVTWASGQCCANGDVVTCHTQAPCPTVNIVCCPGSNANYVWTEDGTQCCPIAQVATISGLKYCCSFAITSGVTYYWVQPNTGGNYVCCPASLYSNGVCCPTLPAGATCYASLPTDNGGTQTCCPNTQFNRDWFTNDTLTGSKQYCCQKYGNNIGYYVEAYDTSYYGTGSTIQYCCPFQRVVIESAGNAFCCQAGVNTVTN